MSRSPRARRPMRVSVIGALCFLALGPLVVAAAPVQQAPAAAAAVSLDDPLPFDPDVRRGSFANGLHYYIRENHEPENRAELRLVVNAGSILEDDDQIGLAHLLEHMAFNGTVNFEKQELVEFFESIGMRLGPDLNAGTSFDETVYMVQIPTDSAEVIGTAFQILEDWAHGLTLESAEIDQERGVVIEEWRLGRGASSRVQDQQLPVMLRDSRYAERLPIGTVESLRTFDHDALRRFYEDWYRPDLMAVVAVGDFDAADIEARIREHFEGIPAASSPRERIAYDVPDHDGTLFSIVTDEEVPQTSVSLYHMGIAQSEPTIGGYRQGIVEGLYNSMLNLRFTEMARQPDAPFLGASSSRGRIVRSEGAYGLGAGVPEDGVEDGLRALLVESERVARFGFTESELERRKADLLRSYERQYADRDNIPSGRLASEYVNAFLNDEPEPGVALEYALHGRFVPEITLEEVNDVGREWIQPVDRVVTVVGPERDDQAMPTEEELRAVIDGVASVQIEPYEDRVIDEPLLAEIPAGSAVVATRELPEGIVEWQLANGIRVALKPTDFREDEVLFRGVGPGGTSLVDDEDLVPAMSAVAAVRGGGLGPHDPNDLRRLLTGKVATVSPFISTYEEGVSGRASPADLETLFQLIYLTFTAPRADSAIFQVFERQNRAALANRDAVPGVAFQDALNRLMTQDHPRFRPVTLETIDHLDLQTSLRIYRERFGDASDFTFVFVGNLDLDTMRPLVERYIGGLPTGGRIERWRDLGVRPPRGVSEETVRRGIEPQSQTRLVFSGPLDYGDVEARTRLTVTSGILRTRLREVLREELGGTYSVGVSASMTWRPEGQYSVSVSFGSDPQRAEELLNVMYQEVRRMWESPPTEGELHDEQEALLRSFETSLESNQYWLSQLDARYRYWLDALDHTYPSGEVLLGSLIGNREAIEGVSPEDVQVSARQYLDLDNRVRVTLLPEEGN